MRLSLLLALGTTPLGAQWATDSALNTVIADRDFAQVIPKVAATPDGGCYVGWFDQASGNYDVYLQRLDAAGVEQWPHNGILISDHPQSTSLVDWSLITDSQGHCVLVFADDRNGGGDFDIYAYRIAPDGSMLWGPDGVTISDDNGFEFAPRVAELTSGAFVFIWSRESNGNIMAQVVSAAGAIQYTSNGLPIGGLSGETAGFCEVVASDAGSYIVTWVRNIASFLSPRHIHAQKFTSAGAPQWAPNPVVVYDASSVPVAHSPIIRSNGAGGAIVGWHASTSHFNSHVQHLDAAGTELFPHNGSVVSTDATRHHLDPALTYLPSTGEILVFFNERNLAQSQWGIYGQKFDAAGVRQWTDVGIPLIPVDAVWEGPPRCLPSGSGAMVFVLQEPTTQFGQEQVLGMRVDGAGAPLWTGQPILVSSILSGKARLPVALTPQGDAVAVWEDNRNGTVDVYGQRIGADGTLGPGTVLPIETFIRGDCNDDTGFDIADPIAMLGYLFPSGGVSVTPVCLDACDGNDDGQLDIGDPVRLLSALFGTTTLPPEPPFPTCGVDPTDTDSLRCDASAACP